MMLKQVKINKCQFIFQVAEVVYVGYGNKETVWSKDLLPPAEGTPEEPVTVSPDDAISSDAAHDTVAAGMASQVTFVSTRRIIFLL